MQSVFAMVQNKIAILSTNEIGDALIRDAALKNISVDVLPFIRTESISSVKVQQEIGQAFTLSATVVFTSTTAVEAVAAVVEGLKPGWKIFCIGHATRQSVENYFGKNLIAGMADNAKELAEVIVTANADHVIFFCGDQRRNELPDLLKKNNIEVNEIIVYQTIATPQTIERKYDGILFFSPSAVKSFFQNNQLDEQTVLFAIGNTTANEIKNYLPDGKAGSKNKIIVASEPAREIVLDEVIHYFQTNSIHH
ncbi:MAG: uroporphyrinogen-III synthase [Chitinophagales bacterium]